MFGVKKCFHILKLFLNVNFLNVTTELKCFISKCKLCKIFLKYVYSEISLFYKTRYVIHRHSSYPTDFLTLVACYRHWGRTVQMTPYFMGFLIHFLSLVRDDY